MRRSLRWLFPVALVAAILTPAIVIAAEECITHYSWKCDDDPNNDCEGYFSPVVPEVYTESPNGDLWYVIRFSPAVSGHHYLRMSGVVHPIDGDPNGTDEEFQALKKQQAGCTEKGFFQGVVTFDEYGYGTPTDFDLGYTSTTDICIGMESSNSDPGLDEMFVNHIINSNHYHPVIATIFDDRSCPDSEYATDGSKISGSLNDLCVCKPNGYEKLQEGGPPHWRLFYVYKFDNISEGSAQTLHVKGRRPNNEDGDDFNILYKWDSTGNCTGLFINSGEAIDTTSSVDHEVDLGDSSGTLCVALDDSTGGTLSDVVFVDDVYVVTTP